MWFKIFRNINYCIYFVDFIFILFCKGKQSTASIQHFSGGITGTISIDNNPTSQEENTKSEGKKKEVKTTSSSTSISSPSSSTSVIQNKKKKKEDADCVIL
jgi:hypothetical protein